MTGTVLNVKNSMSTFFITIQDPTNTNELLRYELEMLPSSVEQFKEDLHMFIQKYRRPLQYPDSYYNEPKEHHD